MDPVTQTFAWFDNMLDAELRYWKTVIPLRVENAWIELQLIWIDIKLALRT